MRFAFTVLTALTGAGVSGVHYGIIPLPDQMSQAVRALGGDPAQIRNLDANAIRAIYDNLMRQVTSPDSSARAGFPGSPVPAPDFSAAHGPAPMPLPAVNNGLGSGIVTQNQQFDNHMQDLRTYAGNPGGWHGAPPH